MKSYLNIKKADLPQLAEDILHTFPRHRLFNFEGEMGSGKTTLIKEFCKKLGVQDKTSSPTFSIVNVYLNQEKEPVYHFDFYRINKASEAIEIGLFDYISSGSYCFMEWPEKIAGVIDDEIVKITISTTDDADVRTVLVEIV